MRKLVILVLALGFPFTAFCQPAKPDSSNKAKEPAVMSSASAAPSTREPCELMSPEEMRMCLVTKPHKAGRSIYCDKVSKSQIESCLKQKQSVPARSGSSAVTFARGR